MRRFLPLVLAGVLGPLAAVLVACGDDENRREIPPDNAQEMQAKLAAVQERAEAGICGSARANLDRLRNTDLEQLREQRVDREIRSELRRGLSQLQEIVSEECEANRPERTVETTETEPPETTVETTPPPTTAETTPPPTTEPEPPPETVPPQTLPPEEFPDDTLPPEEDGGGGGLE